MNTKKIFKIFNVFLVIAFILMSVGCNKFVYTKGQMINDSNAELIDLAARDAAAQIVAMPRSVLNPEQKYVVMSSEKIDKKDDALNALVEDSIISALSQGGFSVLERDKDILLRIVYQENGEKLKTFLVPPTEKDSKTIKTELPKYDIDYGKQNQIFPAKVHENLGTENIDIANHIISYRILETGMKYYKIDERDELGNSQVKRTALVKLNIRIIDTKSSQIVYSDTLSGMIEDIVPTWQVEYLEKTGFEFYPYTLPLQKK